MSGPDSHWHIRSQPSIASDDHEDTEPEYLGLTIQDMCSRRPIAKLCLCRRSVRDDEGRSIDHQVVLVLQPEL